MSWLEADRAWSNEARALQKAESEELEVQKPQVKLRRTVSEVARPASTPPIMASAIKDEDDEDRIIAELEVGQGSPRHQPGVPPCPTRWISGWGAQARMRGWIPSSPLRLVLDSVLLAPVSSPLYNGGGGVSSSLHV